MTEDLPAGSSETGALRSALRLAGSDAARYLPVRFVPALTSLITVPLFTRAIATDDYGAFHVINAFLVLGARVAAESVSAAALRFYWPSKKAGTLRSYTATVVWSVIAALAIAAAIIIGVAWLGRSAIDPLVLRLVPISVAYFFCNYTLFVFMEVLRAANLAKDYARISITATLLTNTLAVVFVWFFHWGAAGIFAGVAAGSFVMIPWALARIEREGSLAPAAVRRETVSEFFAFTAPLVPAGAAVWALGFLDRFVIEAARGASEVGLYSIAYGLGEKIIQLATLPLLLTMLPMLIKTYEEHGQRTAERMQTQFTRYFALATVPLLAGLAVIADDFMAVFTTPEYHKAFPVLGVIAAGTLLAGAIQLASAGLTIHKKSRRIMANTLVATALNIALNIALVPRYGYVAAGWSMAAAYLLLLALTWLQSRPYMTWHVPWGGLLPVVGATAVMALAVWGVTLALPQTVWALLAEGTAGVTVYALALLALGGVRPDERAFARELAASARARLGRKR
ncbi:MAG: lipopolysaccharide biosynthesis protein [Actinobacteria bacterium]|nr:lipopolysaccharide biosynthesis protein [Actinomycetota bacterium]